MSLPLGAAVAAGVLSYLTARAAIRYAIVLGLADVPNERSLHRRVTPRAGGVGFAFIVPAVTAFVTAGRPASMGSVETVLVASAALALVGLADDRWSLSPVLRLAAQIAAAAAVVVAAGDSLSPLMRAAALASIVAFTNLYNFMDGIDGLAATQAVIGAAGVGTVAWIIGRNDVVIAMTILAGGTSGFLAVNWPPARVFMGDVGSTFLGFTFASWALLGMRSGPPVLPLRVWIAALSPFLFDGLLTLMLRLLRGERLHVAHRTHLYQQLVQHGWSHRRTTVLYGVLALAASIVNIVHTRFDLFGPAIFAVVIAAILAPLPAIVMRSRRAILPTSIS